MAKRRVRRPRVYIGVRIAKIGPFRISVGKRI